MVGDSGVVGVAAAFPPCAEVVAIADVSVYARPIPVVAVLEDFVSLATADAAA